MLSLVARIAYMSACVAQVVTSRTHKGGAFTPAVHAFVLLPSVSGSAVNFRYVLTIL